MITVEQQYQPCGCRSVGECFHNLCVEETALSKLVDEFAKEMKAKLFEKYRRDGRTGWDDPANRALIELKLFEHVNRPGQYVDVANLAAFLWNMRDQK